MGRPASPQQLFDVNMSCGFSGGLQRLPCSATSRKTLYSSNLQGVPCHFSSVCIYQKATCSLVEYAPLTASEVVKPPAEFHPILSWRLMGPGNYL